MKPEWGTKRMCGSCGAKFYDMRKPEIVCPKCGTPYVAVAAKPKRVRAEPKPVEPPPKKKKKPAAAEDAAAFDDVEIDDDLDDVDIDDDLEEEDDEDEDIIEDASDLGDDGDDVAEVMENVDGEKEI